MEKPVPCPLLICLGEGLSSLQTSLAQLPVLGVQSLPYPSHHHLLKLVLIPTTALSFIVTSYEVVMQTHLHNDS
jgi:hypothetical protein